MNGVITGIYDREPPYSMEAEVSVLGGMLIEKTAIDAVQGIVTEQMFFRDANRRIFRALSRISERGDAVDVIMLSEELKKTDELDAAGGFLYLGELLDAVPTASNIAYHAEIVREKSQLRALIEQASHIIRDVYEQGERKASEIITEAEQRILAVATVGNRSEPLPMKDLVWKALDQIERWQQLKGKVSGLSTGFASLDHQTTGMHPGELWVIAGRPSMGKTALALDILKHVSLRQRKSSLVKSLEMETTELTIRMIAGEANLNLLSLRSGTPLSTVENERMVAAVGLIHGGDMLLDDHPIASIAELRALARRAHRKTPMDLIVVDYLQLMEGDGRNRTEDVSQISRGLKLLARELAVPVIAVSQLSRGVESRTNKRPVLSDLRESGSIEQDADVVLMVYRPEYYLSLTEVAKAAESPKTDVRGLAEIVIPKQRNGPTGSVRLFFNKPTTRFSEWNERVLW